MVFFIKHKLKNIKRAVILLAGVILLHQQQLNAQVVSVNGAYISNKIATVISMDTLLNENSSIVSNAGTISLATITNNATLQGNGTYKISEKFNNAGTFSHDSSTVHFNGSSNQDIPGLTFHNLTLSGASTTKTVAGAVNIRGSLTLLADITLALGSNNIRLKSDSTYTARVSAVPSSAIISYGSGRFIAERYAIGRRKYRILTSPVTTSPNAILISGEEEFSIWGNWQNQGNNSTPYVATFITGGSAADGYDQQTTNASMFTYNPSTRLYEGFTTANGKNTKFTPLKAGVPYYFFIWGDRTNSPITSSPFKTVLSATGKIITGDQTYNTGSSIPLSNTVDVYTMIGNPFASPIDWGTVSRTNLSNTYWGWDPNLSSTGGYVTVSTTGDVTLISPYSGSLGLDQYIQSGQGFFVKTTAASPELIIKESDKVGYFNPLAFRIEPNNLPLLAINLLHTDVLGTKLLDGALAAFDTSFSNLVGKEDASKMSHYGEELAIKKQSQLLSTDARKMPMDKDTIYINIARLTKAQYTLQIFARYLDNSTLEPYLEDTWLKTSRLLSLSDSNFINFTVNSSIPASYSMNRFHIVFRQSASLSDVITTIKAVKVNRQVKIDWSVSTGSGIQKFEIQRADGINGFIKLGEVAARGTNAPEQYQWIDAYPVSGMNHYRVRIVQADGAVFLSKTVTVKMNDEKGKIKIYPNPILNNEIKFLLINTEKGVYKARLFHASGQLVMDRIFEYNGGTAVQQVQVERSLIPGQYFFQLINNKTKLIQKIIIK